MESGLVGAFKVKDGLFIGDEFAAQDLEFIVANKVSRIVNCAARQVPNHWEPIGIYYLAFPWFDMQNQIALDSGDRNFNNIFQFIEKGLESGDSVLIHSVRGLSRCICIIVAYFMKKFQWSLYKSLDFIAFRRPDIDINPGFLSQLASFEFRVSINSKIPRSENWDDLTSSEEELSLRNTFLNAKIGQSTDYHLNIPYPEKPLTINWSVADHSEPNAHKSRNKSDSNFIYLKSCLKGSIKPETRVLKTDAQISKDNFHSNPKNEKSNKLSFEYKVVNRSGSLNKNDSKLVKEAIFATRGFHLESERGKKTNSKKGKGNLVVKTSRPTTAPQKRNLSPRGSERKTGNENQTKGVSTGSFKRKTK